MNHMTIPNLGIIQGKPLPQQQRSGVPPEGRQQGGRVDVLRRDIQWLRSNIDDVARLNTTAFHGGAWGEMWSDDPKGNDPRRFSHAMVRELCSEVDGQTIAFSATVRTEDEGEVFLGAGISIVLNANGVKAYHVEQFGGQPGDYYLAWVAVWPFRRGEGIFTRLAQARLEVGYGLNVKRMWVQTHEAQQIVQGHYLAQGFRKEGNLEVLSCQGANGEMKPSKRVMLVKHF